MVLEQNAVNLINYLENKPSSGCRNQAKNSGRTDSKKKLQQHYAMIQPSEKVVNVFFMLKGRANEAGRTQDWWITLWRQ